MPRNHTRTTVENMLEPGQTTVGTEVVLRHRRPSVPGAGSSVAAYLDEVDGLLGARARGRAACRRRHDPPRDRRPRGISVPGR
ncbi:thioesterase, FlK family [Nocardia sp. NPDC055053]